MTTDPTNLVPEGPTASPEVPLPRPLLAAVPIFLATGSLAIAAVLAGAPGLAIASIGACALAGVGFSVHTMRMIRRMRLVEERREHVRFQRDMAATVDGFPARVTDLSLGGASLIAEMPMPPSLGSEVELRMELATGVTTLRATVRRALERGYFARMGVQFAEGQREEIVKLGFALLHSEVAPDRSEAEPTAAVTLVA